MTISNISSKATGPVVTKFHIELPLAERRKVCSNSPGHMTNMAAMPVHGKSLYKSSSLEAVNQLPQNLHWVLEYFQDCSQNDLGLTLTYFTTRSNMGKF